MDRIVLIEKKEEKSYFSDPNPKGDAFCETLEDGTASNLGFHERMLAGITPEGRMENRIAIREYLKKTYPETFTDEFLDKCYPIDKPLSEDND